ncbi:GDYXXLXY domain-containing protein [Shewanella pneumatophori]|uniref:GDYXXLXY domain-containing protein n=1 Tax=Shewanella pneumatophori TaxID=314092 RepID=A0A9X1Z916_9GAMM|nr:GDYXXLXY domain-containing protein [Shewanella pneumatophori]MCL1137066.1 GDYXXLXY domain-containing protein [Shewanella pneumatophori]
MVEQHTKNYKLAWPWAMYVVIATILTIVAVVNWDIFKKEQHLADGQVIRLTLAPVDPRSLMQGDYMVLNYALAAEILPLMDEISSDGWLQVSLDENRVASLVSIAKEPHIKQQPSSLVNIQYRLRNNRVKFASNAFFFEEGQAKRYERAKYGEFRVNQQGGLLLQSMLDKNFNKL